MPCPDLRRLMRALVVAAMVALVVVPGALALRFTDQSRLVPDGAVGSVYYHQFVGSGGCGPALPYQFKLLNSSLPPGLSLASNGLVSGTPTQQGSWSIWVELADEPNPPPGSSCNPRKSEEQFTLNIGPTGSVPNASPPSGSGGGGVSLNPCNLPVVGNVCDAVAGAVKKVAAEAGEFVMRGVTAWVTNAAVWVAGKVGELIENTSSPDLQAAWFQGQYQAMLAIAGALALLMLMLAVIQSVIRQDIWILARAAFGYLPMAFILAGVAIAATGLLVAITDDMSAAVVSSLGTEQSDNLLQAVGDAYKNALDENSGIPLFGVFLGAMILAIGAFVLWLEMIIRDAAIYICVFFLPLTFVAMIWPATSRWARRLVELLIAIILAKFVIVSILTLATAAIANTGVTESDSTTFEQMLAGSAILILAAWSPFALLRMIPMMELAAASVASQRSSMSAARTAGVVRPATYMRQAMKRSSDGSGSGTPSYSVACSQRRTAEGASAPDTGSQRTDTAESGAPSGWPSTGGGGSVDPWTRGSSTVAGLDEPAASHASQPPSLPDDRRHSPAGPTSASSAQPSGSSDTPPSASSPPAGTPPSRPRPPEPPPDQRPPPETPPDQRPLWEPPPDRRPSPEAPPDRRPPPEPPHEPPPDRYRPPEPPPDRRPPPDRGDA